MDLDIVIKIAILVVGIGVSIKAIKFISGLIFKLSFIALIFLTFYNLFI